jgi:long-chain acyl-CoA synthetase
MAVSVGAKLGWPASMLEGLGRQVVNGVEITVYMHRPKTLDEMFRNTVARCPDREALICGNTRLTYREFDSMVNNMAAALKGEYGVQKGDRIGLLLMNEIEFCVSLFAIVRSGAIAVPLNTRLKCGELKFMMQDSGMKVLISDPVWWKNVEPIKQELPCTYYFITGATEVPGTLPLTRLTENEARETVQVPLDEQDVAIIVYSSGTTGLPKGSMATHFNVVHSVISYYRCYGVRPDDRGISAVPLFHVTGLVAQFMTLIYAGGSIVLLARMHVEELLKLLAKEKVTYACLVPGIYTMLMNHPQCKNYDLSELRCGGIGGSPVPIETVRSIKAWLPRLELYNTYGLTEVASPATILPAVHAGWNVASVGWPIPTSEVKIVDPETGADMAYNVAGELLIKGANVTRGYWNNEAATKKAIVDGWLHTGDIARIDEDGFVYIMDRIKDMINRCGEKVYCVEVENVLYNNDKVLEAVVVGVPDDVYGETVKAVVVPKDGIAITEQEIKDWVAERMAKFKIPAFVEIVAELPKNSSGKVIKSALRYIPKN